MKMRWKSVSYWVVITFISISVFSGCASIKNIEPDKSKVLTTTIVPEKAEVPSADAKGTFLGMKTGTAISGGVVTRVLSSIIKFFNNKSLPSKPDNFSSYKIVKIFYATDRNYIEEKSTPSKAYGSERGPVTYGTCEVSVPASHNEGEIERSPDCDFIFLDEPGKYMILKDVSRLDKNKYFKKLVERVRDPDSNAAFIFVHGFNVTFEDAAYRTAQMCYDLMFDGAPIFYSWPSQGILEYEIAKTNAELTKPNLKHFLEDIAASLDTENIYLIAHSIGARTLSFALVDLFSNQPDLRKRFKEIILAAPDISANDFKRDIAPKIVTDNPSVTIYVSSEDVALNLAETIDGCPRWGACEAEVLVLPGIETIDTTELDTGFWDYSGHSYYSEEKPVLTDMFYLISQGLRADKRFLSPIDSPSGRYWKFRK